jgi:hypothetical protein
MEEDLRRTTIRPVRGDDTPTEAIPPAPRTPSELPPESDRRRVEGRCSPAWHMSTPPSGTHRSSIPPRRPSGPPSSAPRRTPKPPEPRSGSERTPPPERIRVPEFDARGSDRPEPLPEAALSGMDRAELLVRELRRCSPGEDSPIVGQLVALGESALPAVAQAFPGATWLDRQRPLARLPRAAEISACAGAIVAFGPAAVPYVEWLLGSESEDVRFYAVIVAAEIGARELLPAIRDRLIDERSSVRDAAIRSLASFGGTTGYDETRAWLRGLATDEGSSGDARRYAVVALHELRDAGAVSALVRVLGDRDAAVARYAHDALRVITGHDFGSLRIAWSAWLRRHRDADRLEWLIDGLTDRRTDVRARAHEELVAAAGFELVPWDAARPRADWKQLQRAWRRWWDERHGAR